MKTLRYVLTLCTVLSLFCLAGPLALAQEMEEPQVATGELIAVDPEESTILIRTEAGQDLKFHYTETTEVVSESGTSEGLASMSGKQVTVHYRVDEEQAIAVRIEVKNSEGQ